MRDRKWRCKGLKRPEKGKSFKCLDKMACFNVRPQSQEHLVGVLQVRHRNSWFICALATVVCRQRSLNLLNRHGRVCLPGSLSAQSTKEEIAFKWVRSAKKLRVPLEGKTSISRQESVLDWLRFVGTGPQRRQWLMLAIGFVSQRSPGPQSPSAAAHPTFFQTNHTCPN